MVSFLAFKNQFRACFLPCLQDPPRAWYRVTLASQYEYTTSRTQAERENKKPNSPLDLEKVKSAGGRALVSGIRMGSKSVLTAQHAVKVRDKEEVYYPVVQCEIHGIGGNNSPSYFVIALDAVRPDPNGGTLGDGRLWPKIQFNLVDKVLPLARGFTDQEQKQIPLLLKERDASIRCGNGEPKKVTTKRKADEASGDIDSDSEQCPTPVVTRGSGKPRGGGRGRGRGRGSNK